MHSANNLFHCSLCDRGFRQKNVFLYHLRHRHSVSTETLDRRKYPTELKDYQSIMDTLPPFVLADSTAIASSEKHLDAMLFGTLDGSLNGNNQITLAQEERLPMGNFDDGTNQDNVSNSQVNCSISYKCNLCLVFFVGYEKYKQHVEEEHNNVEMLLDSKPILCSSLSESGTLGCSNLSKNNGGVSVSGDDSVQNNSSNANVNLVTSSNDANCNEKGNFCIPCQQSFANEEEFESHSKIHVQSILGESNASCDKSNVDHSKHCNSFSKSLKSNCDTPKSNNSCSFNFPSHSGSNISFAISNTSDEIRMNSAPVLNLDLQAHSAKSNSKCINKNLKSRTQSLGDKVLNTESKCDTMSGSSHHGFQCSFYKCKFCNEKFREKVAFEYHRQMHMNTRAFKCEYCKIKFKSKQLLLAHTRFNHMKTFKCNSCSRLFNYRSIFDFHKKNCAKKVNLENGSKGSFSLPLIDIEKLLSSDVSGIAGIIPICDKNVSKNSNFKYGIPIVSVEGMKNFSNFSYLNTLEINGLLK